MYLNCQKRTTAANYNTSHRYLSNQCLGCVYTFIFGTGCNRFS